jgi:gliding motility-associated protein GldE
MEDPEPIFYLLSYIPNISSIFIGFTLESGLVLLSILVLLLFSGMISGSEIAFFSISPSQKEEINERESKLSKKIIRLLNQPKDLLAGILILNNFINIAIVLLFTVLTREVFDFTQSPILGFVFQVIFITSVLLLFGEIMPKILAKQRPIVFIELMTNQLLFVLKIFKPLIYTLSKTTSVIDKHLENKKPQLSMDDLSDVVDLAGELENMEVEEEDKKILKGIATFGDTEVSEIMKARVDVKAIDYQVDFSVVISHIQEWGYSRIPVFEESLDSIKGVLYVKDLLTYLDKDNLNWKSKIRPAFFVPENKKINDLLQEFRSKKIHLAIVVDEYGGTPGIVTLEDVLEEIVGEISDEYDIENEDFQYTKTDNNVWVFEAKSSILDFSKIIDIDNEMFDEIRGESDTLAGLILEIKGDFPTIHEKLVHENIEFEILKMDKRRISRVRIKKLY